MGLFDSPPGSHPLTPRLNPKAETLLPRFPLAEGAGRTEFRGRWNTVEPKSQNPKHPLKPYAEIREAFFVSRQGQLRTQGPITGAAIRKLEKTRKYAHSPASAAKRS